LYFEKCDKAIEAWRANGPQPLNTIPRALDGTPITVTISEEELKEVEEGKSSSIGVTTAADIVALEDAVDEEEEEVVGPPDEAAETTEDANMEKKKHDDEGYGEEKKECGGDGGDDDDEEEEVAPTSPPSAFTARATSNLEVSLDEGYGEAEDEDDGIDEECDFVIEKEEMEEEVDDKVNKEDEEEAAAEDNNDEEKDQVLEISPLDTAGSTERNERTGMYRHTWNDLVRVADSKDSFVSNITASNEEEEGGKEEEEEVEGGTTAAVDNTAGDVKNGDDVKMEEKKKEEATDDPLKVEEEMTTENDIAVASTDDCHSGIWLFTDRENITHFFKPNFLGYDTVENRRIIFDVLKEEWDEKSLSFKPCGQGSMTKKKKKDTSKEITSAFARQVDEMVSGVSGVISTVIDGVCSPQHPPHGKEKSTENPVSEVK
jgi:hypothetical protein